MTVEMKVVLLGLELVCNGCYFFPIIVQMCWPVQSSENDISENGKKCIEMLYQC